MTILATKEYRIPYGWWLMPSLVFGGVFWAFLIYGAVQFVSHGFAS